MKGIVLVILLPFIGAVSSLAGGSDFGVETSYSLVRDPAATLRLPVVQRRSHGQWITDAQSDRGPARPILAYTLLRFESKYTDVAVQPVLGRINGAQFYLSF